MLFLRSHTVQVWYSNHLEKNILYVEEVLPQISLWAVPGTGTDSSLFTSSLFHILPKQKHVTLIKRRLTKATSYTYRSKDNDLDPVPYLDSKTNATRFCCICCFLFNHLWATKCFLEEMLHMRPSCRTSILQITSWHVNPPNWCRNLSLWNLWLQIPRPWNRFAMSFDFPRCAWSSI